MKAKWLMVLAVALLPASPALPAVPGFTGTTSQGEMVRATVGGDGRIVLELGFGEKCPPKSLSSTFGSLTTSPIAPRRNGTFVHRETAGEISSRLTVRGRRAGDVISGSFTITSTQGGVTARVGALRTA